MCNRAVVWVHSVHKCFCLCVCVAVCVCVCERERERERESLSPEEKLSINETGAIQFLLCYYFQNRN